MVLAKKRMGLRGMEAETRAALRPGRDRNEVTGDVA